MGLQHRARYTSRSPWPFTRMALFPLSPPKTRRTALAMPPDFSPALSAAGALGGGGAGGSRRQAGQHLPRRVFAVSDPRHQIVDLAQPVIGGDLAQVFVLD